MPKKKAIDPRWEEHREEIELLYSHEPLKTVIAHMEQTYGFSKKSSQYYAQFKIWNNKKRTESDSWKFISYWTAKRKSNGQDTVFYKNKSLVSEAKVKKGIARHVPLSFQYSCVQAPPTPEGISIRTPPAIDEGCDDGSGQEAPNTIPVHPAPPSAVGSPLWLDDLPCFQFQNILANHFYGGIQNGAEQDCFNSPFSASYPPPLVNTSSGDATALHWPDLDDFSALNFNQPWLLSEGGDLDAPFAPNPIDHNAPPHLGINLVSENSLHEARLLLSDCLKEQTRAQLPPAGNDIDDIALSLDPVMIEQAGGDLANDGRKLFGSSRSDALLQFLQFCVYLSSNNLMTDDQMQRLLLWLSGNGFRHMIKDILRSKSATIEVFASNLLRIAVKQEDIETTQILIEAGIETDDLSGLTLKRTALQEAVEVGNTHLVRILLEAGANPNSAGGRETPLFIAVRRRRTLDLVRMLLDNGADPNLTRDLDGLTPLHAAVRRGQVDVIQLLLDAKANPNPPMSDICTPLQLACVLEDVEVIEMLVHYGADVNATDRVWFYPEDNVFGNLNAFLNSIDSRHAGGFYGTPILLAADRENWEAVQVLLEAGARIKKSLPKHSPIHLGDAIEAFNRGYDDFETIPVLSPLQAAVRAEDFTMVRLLLSAGAPVDERPLGGYGYTALQIAALVQNKRLVQILLRRGADINAPAGRQDGYTALQAASKQPHGTELLNFLIKSGAKVNAPPNESFGFTALQAAAFAGNIDAVEELIKAGADVNAYPSPEDGMTALQAAASANSGAIVKTLLEARPGADVNAAPARYGGVTPLRAAVKYRNMEIVQLLLAAGASIDPLPNEELHSPLLQAVEDQNIEMATFLLSKGADPNVPFCCHGVSTPLEEAAYRTNIPLIRLLLSWSVDTSCAAFKSSVQAALKVAARGSLRAVKELFAAGADLNAPEDPNLGSLALRSAVEWGRTRIVKFLLDHGAPLPTPNCKTNEGLLVLVTRHWRIDENLVEILVKAGADVQASAATSGDGLDAEYAILQRFSERGNLNLVQMVLVAGANVNIRSISHSGPVTALQGAVQSRNIDIVQALIDRRADINAPANEKCGQTALQGAVSTGDFDIIRLLLQYGAEVNAPPSPVHGRTALQEAASRGNVQLARLLLEHGADVNAPPSPVSGRTALQEAAGRGNVQLTQLLLQHGADVNAPPARNAGATALQSAALAGNIRLVVMFLSVGADINGAPAMVNGRTAIEAAAENGRLHTLRLLLNFHSNTDDLDLKRQRAAELAINNGYSAIARFIKAYKKH